ncbi:MAG TPA: hypothetical protein VKQ32_23225, partial [Polyangia bacterium]|nr:hypothetical protein [Polyangia bacterium]
MTARNPKTASGADVDGRPALADALESAWRDFFAHARELPAHPAAHDFLQRDLKEAFARLIPADASVFEAGCAEGDLLASLPNARRMGVDYLPDVVERARARHPEITFEVADVTADGESRLGVMAAGGWD